MHCFYFSSHRHWFRMPRQLPCSAWVLLTTASMCWNHFWSSGRVNRVKKSLWPPASFSAHTLRPPPQTWARSSCANMSRYKKTENNYIDSFEKVESLLNNYFFLMLGACCWCFWSLLSTFDWNGSPAALSNQEDCWHQPTYSTSCVWPLLVLLSLWSKPSLSSLVLFSFLTFIDKWHKCNPLILLFHFASIWWFSRHHLSGDKSGSCCCLSAAPRKSIGSWGICILSTPMCAASRSFWRSRASSSGQVWSRPHLAQLSSMTR